MMSKNQYQLINHNDSVIVPNLKLANTFISRFMGLMGTSELHENEGLLITPCKQLHTHFMNYAIDIIFLNQEDLVIEILSDVRPWRFTKYIKESKTVLEISANTAKNKIKIGDRLTIVQHEQS